jgi:hypothetical protein
MTSSDYMSPGLRTSHILLFFFSALLIASPTNALAHRICDTPGRTIVLFACNSNKRNNQTITKSENTLIGKWVRIGQTGPIGLDFKDNGLVEGDFGNDQTVDFISGYELSGDTISFIDREGHMCEGYGQYKVYQTDYYVSFDLIDDK